MRKSYKAFEFNGQTAPFSDILNITLGNDMYEDSLRGSREIKTEKIPGRDIPYFYEVEDSPLGFNVNFAFQRPVSKRRIKDVVKRLASQRTYREMTFGEYEGGTYVAKSPIYNLIFKDDIEMTFVQQSLSLSELLGTGNFVSFTNNILVLAANVAAMFDLEVGNKVIVKKSSNFASGTITNINESTSTVIIAVDNSLGAANLGTGAQIYLTYINPENGFLGHLNLSAICDRPYGYLKIQAGDLSNNVNTRTLNSPADLNFSPILIISSVSGFSGMVRIINTSNNSSITFSSLEENEQITINPNFKTILSNKNNIYTRWQRDELFLTPGPNVLNVQTIPVENQPFVNFTGTAFLKIFIQGEAPIYIRG
jgi:hypothetical protein